MTSKLMNKMFIILGALFLISGIFIMIMNSKNILKETSYYLSGVLFIIIGILLLSYEVYNHSTNIYPMGDFLGTCLFVIGIFFFVLGAYNVNNSPTIYYSLGGSFTFIGLIMTSYVLMQDWNQSSGRQNVANYSPQPDMTSDSSN